MKLLVTISTTHNKYEPLSTIVEIKDLFELRDNKKRILTEAFGKICKKMNTEYWCLKRDGYTQIHTKVLFNS